MGTVWLLPSQCDQPESFNLVRFAFAGLEAGQIGNKIPQFPLGHQLDKICRHGRVSLSTRDDLFGQNPYLTTVVLDQFDVLVILNLHDAREYLSEIVGNYRRFIILGDLRVRQADGLQQITPIFFAPNSRQFRAHRAS